MNYIAALMLLVLKDEERTFWLFDTLVTEILPRTPHSRTHCLPLPQPSPFSALTWRTYASNERILYAVYSTEVHRPQTPHHSFCSVD